MEYIRRFDTAQEKAEATLVYPNVNYVEETDVVSIEASAPTPPGPHDYSQDYFTLSYTTAGTFKMPSVSVDYSTDGQSWTTLASNTVSPSMSAGTKVRMKRVHGLVSLGRIVTTGQFTVEGNAMSLVYGDNFTGQTSLTGYSLYNGLLSGSTGLTSAANLVLPATTLVPHCYDSMFADCTSLTTAPALPATNLGQAYNCYEAMFSGCTSLATAPTLPATALTVYCYANMFQGCTSLTGAPDLPAETLVDFCYQSMFSGCTSLEIPPYMSATTLATACCEYMFQDCTSLTDSPELMPTAFDGNTACYSNMFNGCSSLTAITANFEDWPGTDYTNDWVVGVAAYGTFFRNPDAQWESYGDSAVPLGWDVYPPFDHEEPIDEPIPDPD